MRRPTNRRLLFSCLLAVAPALCVGVTARAKAADAGTGTTVPKVGYIDMARALNEVEDGKQAKAKLKADFELKQKKLDKLQNDAREKQESFEKRVAMMKPEARQAKETELRQSLMEVQQTYMQLQQELVESEGAVTQEIRKKLQAVIDKVGDREEYFLILNTGENVLYNKRHMDMTDDVIREYNKQYGKK